MSVRHIATATSHSFVRTDARLLTARGMARRAALSRYVVIVPRSAGCAALEGRGATSAHRSSRADGGYGQRSSALGDADSPTPPPSSLCVYSPSSAYITILVLPHCRARDCGRRRWHLRCSRSGSRRPRPPRPRRLLRWRWVVTTRHPRRRWQGQRSGSVARWRRRWSPRQRRCAAIVVASRPVPEVFFYYVYV